MMRSFLGNACHSKQYNFHQPVISITHKQAESVCISELAQSCKPSLNSGSVASLQVVGGCLCCIAQGEGWQWSVKVYKPRLNYGTGVEENASTCEWVRMLAAAPRWPSAASASRFLCNAALSQLESLLSQKLGIL